MLSLRSHGPCLLALVCCLCAVGFAACSNDETQTPDCPEGKPELCATLPDGGTTVTQDATPDVEAKPDTGPDAHGTDATPDTDAADEDGA